MGRLISMNTIQVHPINPQRLTTIWQSGMDEFGHRPTPESDPGNPLRCCLQRSQPSEQILLIGYSAQSASTPWAETGPVFIHAEPCAGYRTPQELPVSMRTGPRVLRSYREDGSMDYDGITAVADGQEVEPELARLLARPGIREVHVRAHPRQCFQFRATLPGVAPLE